MRPILALTCTAALLAACGRSDAPPDSAAAAAGPSPIAYPDTRRADVVDDYFGTRVADPYRWMEDQASAEVAEWVAAQNAVARPWLDAVAARTAIRERVGALWSYARSEAPAVHGGRAFYLANDGRQNQDVLFVSDDFGADERVLIDPNTLSEDGTVALSGHDPSGDGRLVAWSSSDGGSDWDVWRVRDVETGEDLPGEVRDTKFTPAAWAPDASGFFYSRYPRDASGQADDSRQVEVWFHTVGTEQSDDLFVYRITDHPTRNPYPEVSNDGAYLLFWVFDGYASNGLYYRDLTVDDAEVVRLFDAWDGRYQYLHNEGREFLVYTTAGAPNGRVVAVDLDDPEPESWRDVVAESEHAIEDVTFAGGKLFVRYVKDASSAVDVVDPDDGSATALALPGLGTVSGLEGDADAERVFYHFTGYTTPGDVFRFDVASGEITPVWSADTVLDTGELETRQVFFESRDGTRIPMFLVHRRDLEKNGNNATLLYGYGGFNVALTPEWDTRWAAWLDMGGVLAVANLRGGSEYGEAWHAAGTKLNKQNVFDDFIAAAEWLIAEGYTSRRKLAAYGRSNGGLLVGAVVTQRPDLFGAAVPVVGVLDMLRYHTASANARQWSSDYGLSEDPEQFEALYAYSPYHRVTDGTCYPPTLVTTADRDDRVVPWHSFKFAARMQAAQACDNPVLIMVETRAGHGAGKPAWMRMDEIADRYAFLHEALGMDGS